MAPLGNPVLVGAQDNAGHRQEPRVAALRRGGFIIYFRHAATDPDQADTSDPALGRCDGQRNLSADGRRMAKELGRALHTLGIPVGRVLTSPYCRAIDTAELAFGRHEASSTLYLAIGLDKVERDHRSAELRQMLSTPPQPGWNTVIVSHHANLKEAVDVWPRREGDAHLFRPGGDGRFEHVGEVTIDEWSRLAGRMAPASSRTPTR